MTTITFIGGEETGDAGSVEWGRYKFALNLPVECTDKHIIAKARTNRFFKVDGAAKGKVEVAPDEPMTLKELLSGEPVPFFLFKKEAKRHIDASESRKMPNPATKEAIIEVLKLLPLEPDEIEIADGLPDPQS